MSDTEFPEGIFVKPPHAKAPEFVKASISIKREEAIAWLTARSGEWVNLDVKESRGGKWYCALNTYKPKERAPSQPVKDAGDPEDNIPF